MPEQSSSRSWLFIFTMTAALIMAAAMVTFTVAEEPRYGVLKGRVVGQDGKPVPGAFVSVPGEVEDSPREIRTDDQGRFRIARTPVGYHEITAQRRGYQYRSKLSGSIVEGKETEMGDIVLAPQPDSLNAGVNYPHTITPGNRRGMYVSGSSSAEKAVIRFELHPYDMIKASTSEGGEYNYRYKFLKNIAATPIETWERVYATSEKDGGFYGSPATPVIHKPGTYLVVAKMGALVAGDSLNVSSIALIVKRDKTSMLAFVADMRDGSPVSGADVQVYNGSAITASGQTGGDGLATIDCQAQEYSFVAASYGGSVAYCNSSLYASSSDRVMIYTDRPIYRPGHTVNFKGIFRIWKGGDYDSYAGQNVDFQIEDPEGRSIASIQTVTNQNGTASSRWTVPEDARLGNYRIKVKVNGNECGAYFAVEEYRKPEYTVGISIPKSAYIRGDKFEASIRANYYFGAPVAGAQVSYVIYRSNWYFWDFDNAYEEWFQQDDGDSGYDYGGYGEVVQEGKGETDENGELKVRIDTAAQATMSRWVIEARVVDPAKREVVSQAGANIAPAAFFIQVSPRKYVYQPDEFVNLDIKTVDWEHKPVPNQKFDVLIEKVFWSKNTEVGNLVGRGSASTGPDARGLYSFKAGKPGSYKVTLKGKDSQGRVIEADAYVWVTNELEFSEQESPPGQMLTVVKDKKLYRRGDTAHLLLHSKVPNATVLLTVEGGRLFDSRIVRMKGPGASVEIPLEDEYVPNVTISASYIHTGKMASANTSLVISPLDKLLNVKIKSSKERYHPGEMAEYIISTFDQSGNPVPAEVSFGVVDESIYALRADHTPDIQKNYWGPVSNSVSTSTSVEDYWYGGVNKLSENTPRKYFPDTAYWNPGINTDASGRAVVRFRMPDNLTTWRAAAIAVTADTRVGSAVHKRRVFKDVIVRLQAPRFFRQKDEITLGVVVHNYTEENQRISVRLESGLDGSPGASPVQLIDGNTRIVEVVSNGVGKVEFAARVGKPVLGRKVRLTASAKGAKGASDALQMDYELFPHSARAVSSVAGGTKPDKREGDFRYPVNLDGDVEGSSLRIDLSPSAAGNVIRAIEYLAGYPWGCVEQTVSRFVPDVVAKQAFDRLGIRFDKKLSAELPSMISKGIRQLKSLQHDDGSFGWYSEADSDSNITAYVLLGLAEAEKAGVSVPREIIGRASDWMARQIQQGLPERPLPRFWESRKDVYRVTLENRAYTLYALAASGKNVRVQLNQLWRRRADLSTMAVSSICLAANANGDQVLLRQSADVLNQRLKKTTVFWFWPAPDSGSFWSDLATTAAALRALLNTGVDASSLEPVVRYLATKQSDGHWRDTWTTSAVVLSLVNYLSRITPGASSASVIVNGRSLGSFSFPAQVATAGPRTVIVPSSYLRKGQNWITIRKSGAGSLYWTGVLTYRTNQDEIPAKSGFYQVSKALYHIELEKQGSVFKEKLALARGGLRIGEILKMVVTVKPKADSSYALVDVPLPSGFEVVNRQREWNRHFSGIEVHDERVGIFARWLPAGENRFEFEIRPELSGDLQDMPVETSAMYSPLMFGRSAGGRIAVK